MKYFVRTTNDRKLDDSYSQIEYELLLDQEHKPVKSLIEQYNYINNFDCVLLEDDLILCKGFKNKIEEVIRKHPNQIINFFFNPTLYIVSESTTQSFAFSQCRYYPRGVTKKIADELLKMDILDKPRTAQYVTEACKKLKYETLQYRPCLVQHLDNDSLCHNAIRTKRTPFFIDYLEELNISYEEAKKEENFKRLCDKMKEHFQIVGFPTIQVGNTFLNMKLGYVLHLYDTNLGKYYNIFQDYAKNTVTVDNKISLVSIMNEDCYNQSLLVSQCKNSKIDLITSAEAFNVPSSEWVNTLKLKYIVSLLEKVNTEYVLVLDGRDTCLLQNLDDKFINYFKTLNTDIVFNRQLSNYPNIPEFKNKNCCYINAGVCFGYTKSMLEFYKQCYELSLVEEYISEYNHKPSEQYIVRKIAHQTDIKVSVDKDYEMFTTGNCDIIRHHDKMYIQQIEK